MLSVLDTKITVEEALTRGATKCIEPSLFEELSGGQDRTVGEILRMPIRLRLAASAVMYEQVMSPQTMYRVAVAVADEALSRLAAEGIYIDIRSRKAVRAMERFAASEIGVGELGEAREKADLVAYDLLGENDDRATLGSRLATTATWINPRSCALTTIGTALLIYPSPEDQKAFLATIEKVLSESEK